MTATFRVPPEQRLGETIEFCRAQMESSVRWLKNVDVAAEAVTLMDLETLGAAPADFDPAWPMMSAATASARRFPGKLTAQLTVRWTADHRVTVTFDKGDDRFFALLRIAAEDLGWQEFESFTPDEEDVRAGRFVMLDSAVFDALNPTVITGPEDTLDQVEQTVLPLPDPMQRLRVLVERTSVHSETVRDALWTAVGLEDPVWVELSGRMYPVEIEDLHPDGDQAEGGETHFLEAEDIERLRRRAFSVLRMIRTV